MMNKILFVFCAAVFFTGCPLNSPKLDLSSDAVQNAAVTQMKTVVFPQRLAEYECARLGYTLVPQFETDAKGNKVYKYSSCDTAHTDAGAEARAREIRNGIFIEGSGLVDEAYGKYKDALKNNRSIGSFLADLLEIGLGSSIGIVNGRVRELQILGVALTGFRATRKSARLNLYDDQTTEVILDQMDASRSDVWLKFKNFDSQKSTKDYPVEEVFKDIYTYFRVGTQTEAFTKVRRGAAANAQNKEDKVLRLKEIEDKSLIFSPPEDVSKAARDITFIRNQFITVSNLNAGDAASKTAQDKLSDNLKKIFDEINAGAKAAEFKPYLDDVKLAEGKNYKDLIEKLQSATAADVASVNLKDRLTIIFELYKRIFAEKDEAKKNPLILEFKEILTKNQ